MTTKADLALTSMDELARFAEMIAKAGYFDVTPAQAAIKILAGRELNLGPLQAMMNVHVIPDSRGRHHVTLAAGLVGALIKRSGRYDYRVVETSAKRCEIEFHSSIVIENRHGEQTKHALGAADFTIEEARAAGIADKPNWKRYPADMLFARALTRGARRFTPDVFGGPIYTPDEISGDPTGLPDMEVTDRAPELGHDAGGGVAMPDDPMRAELLEDLVLCRQGHIPNWFVNEIVNDPVGGHGGFGDDVRWQDGVPDTPEGKAIRQKFHIWASEAGRHYEDVQSWPLDAIKGQAIINMNRHIRGQHGSE